MNSIVKKLCKSVLSALPLKIKRNLLFLHSQGRLIPAVPMTFSEKIQWRILSDRRELVARGGDKLSMKSHAEQECPGILIPETLWSGTDLLDIYDFDWECEWVLKPISGSGYSLFGSGSLSASRVDLVDVNSWSPLDSYQVFGEWAYGQSRPGYLIERRIATETGESPHDLRFFVFAGRVKMVQVDTPRVSKVHRRFYSPIWDALPYQQGGKALADVQPRPAMLEHMIIFAEEIGRDYDFIRVDLYEAKDKIYFGEITPYPTGGLAKYSDPDFDRKLGDYWVLPEVFDS